MFKVLKLGQLTNKEMHPVSMISIAKVAPLSRWQAELVKQGTESDE
jgi:hypothetical protein